MRKGYIFAALAAFGLIGMIGWATHGLAQPVYDPPVKAPADSPKAKASTGDPLTITIPEVGGPAPIGKPKTDSTSTGVKPPAEGSKPPVVIEPIAPPKSSEPRKLPVQSPVKPEEPNRIKVTDPIKEPTEKPIELPGSESSSRPLNAEIVASGKSEPSVSLEWVGPTAVKVGMPADYSLVVRNTCGQPVQKVVVQMRAPTGVTIVNSEPKAEGNENVLLWELGTLLARQERRVAVKMMAPQRGDMACQAWVTFTGASVMKLRVREPKLLVKMQAPERIMVGDPANVVMNVSNPGDHPADHVKITAILAEGLESVRGNKLNYDLGTLSAGETRTVTIPCVTKTAGQQKCEVFAEADGGLKAGDNLALNVIQPRLDLAVIGPKMRYEGKKATYTVKVTNPGDAPASNVFITEMVPNGFKFHQAEGGGQHDEATRSVKWFIGELPPGQSREVKIDLVATSQGEFVHKVVAHASRGMKAEQDVKTVVEGISAISMEVIDTEDPVEVGTDTSYEIRIANTGTKAETDVKLVCNLPAQVKMKSVAGPVRYDVVGNEIIFHPLPRLAPRADAVFKVTVTAVAKGDARFKASLTTASIVEPVTKVEVTKVYAD